MLERTNYGMLCDLLKEYEPETRGILNGAEFELVKTKLHLKEMNLIELQNMRDYVVCKWAMTLYSNQQNHTYEEKEKLTEDKMSAITYVIDVCKIALGGEV